MSSNNDAQATIRLYLLGQLGGGVREEFEQRLLTDSDLFEELLAIEDELIDEHLAGLRDDQVEMFEKHFLVTPERQQKLRFARALRKYATAHPTEEPTQMAKPEPRAWNWQQLFSSPYLRAAAIASLVVIAALGVWRIFVFQSDVDEGLLALNAAYREQRPLEARITQLNYAPYVTTRGEVARANSLERDRAERILLDAVRDHPSTASRHALGKFYLTQKEFEKAISQFEEAEKGDPKNAKIYADLGAALLEKGKTEIQRGQSTKSGAESGKGFEYLARSLQNLNQALELDGDLLEALFNRASLYEAMALLPQAEEDLRKYLEKDPNSKWADEARQKLKLIEQERTKTSSTGWEIFQEFLKQQESSDEERTWTTVSNYQNRTGNVVVEQLLDTYLEHAEKNQKKEADRALQLLSYVGDLEIRRGEDRFFFDLARFYESATPERRALAVRARDMMKKSHAGWGQLEVKQNLSLFAEAKDLFERAGDFPESRFAEYWISFCHFREHDQELSKQILHPFLLVCENRGYSWLQSRGLYLLSAIQFDLNEHSKAVDFALQCFQLSERTNDSVGLLNASGALIEYYRYLGNYSKSLTFIQRSLSLLNSKPLDPIQSARHYGVVAFALATIGFYDAAAGYQTEALRLAINTGSVAAKANNYSFMGMINGKLKNFSEATKEAQLGFDLAQALSDHPAGRGLMAYAALQMGNIYKDAEDFDKAIPYYTQSIELYQTFPNFQTHLYQAHKGRLFCYLRQQNDPLAREEISIMLGLMEKYRSKISGENSRNTFFDIEHNVFDAAIEFEYSRMKNPERAFSYLNLAQARSLLDLLNADKDVRAKVQDSDIKFQAVSEPLSLEKIKQQLPEQAQILQYVVLEDKLLIWVISTNDFQVREKQITRKNLNEKLLRYLNIISRPPGDDALEERELAKDLYSIVVQPVESLLDKEKLLCIIPDGTLSYLPFAPLISASGKYFFEEQLLMSSPSPSVFLSCSENARKKSGAKEERILSVGNPRFDRGAFPDFDDLPAARKEALEVSSRYNLQHSLVDDRATATAVKSEIEKSEVVHLALHSSIDDEVPLRSKLLLAKAKGEAADGSSGSALYTYEIYNLKLRKTRLVVLSSCQSGAERYYGGEGMASLARAFIGAGVPLVVASLWPVDSNATEELMVSFHKHRREEGASTVGALRKAQQDMLGSEAERFRRPYYWAAFVVNGGYAQF